jgi:hypothetical protein
MELVRSQKSPCGQRLLRRFGAVDSTLPIDGPEKIFFRAALSSMTDYKRERPIGGSLSFCATNLRRSVAKAIHGMSHQHADAQNKERSYNSGKHERSLTISPSKRTSTCTVKNNSEITQYFSETRCALATATFIQHPERLAGVPRASAARLV